MNNYNQLTRNNISNIHCEYCRYSTPILSHSILYQEWKKFILNKTVLYNLNYSKFREQYVKGSPITVPREYDFQLTITFKHPQFDQTVVKSTSHLLRVINKLLSRSNYIERNRYIKGFAFAERHYRSLELEGSFHLHLMCYFSDGFHEKLSMENIKSTASKAAQKTTSSTGHSLFATNGVQVDEAYDSEGLMNYISKQLSEDILDERIMIIGPNGMDGYVPSDEREKPKWNSVH